MDNSVQITDAERDEIYNMLSTEMINALESGTVSYESMQEAGQAILMELDAITQKGELINFLDNLAERWPIFQSISLTLKEKEAQLQDQAIISQTREQIQQITQ